MRSEIADFDSLTAFLTLYHTTFELIEKCGLLNSEVFLPFLTTPELRVLNGPIPFGYQELAQSRKSTHGEIVFQRQDVHELLYNEQQHAIFRPPTSLRQFEAWFAYKGKACLTYYIYRLLHIHTEPCEVHIGKHRQLAYYEVS